MTAMPWFFPLAVVLCVALHLAVIAATGRVFGVALRQVDLGIGPTLLRSRRLRIRLLPLAGSVHFQDGSDGPPDAAYRSDRFDAQPLWKRVCIGLSGCVALMVLAFALAPSTAGPEWWRGFGQIVGGALSPLGEAQDLLAGARDAILSLPPAALLALVAAKFAALNLLPLAPFNGGQVVGMVLGPGRTDGTATPWMQASILLALALLASWCVALGAFVLG